MSKPIDISSIRKFIDESNESGVISNDFKNSLVNMLSNIGDEEDGKNMINITDFSESKAAIFAEFDVDGDGKLSPSEILQAALSKKQSDKERKYLIWAFGVLVFFFVAILAAFAGILHLQFQANKDTELASSGIMMMKDTAVPVEVSVKAHGEIFSSDGTYVDVETGKSSICISATTAKDMFESVTFGTNAKLLSRDANSSNIAVYNLEGICNSDGSQPSTASWEDDAIVLGSIALVPSLDCTEIVTSVTEEDGGRRHLSESQMMDDHRALRDYTTRTLYPWDKDEGEQLSLLSWDKDKGEKLPSNIVYSVEHRYTKPGCQTEEDKCLSGTKEECLAKNYVYNLKCTFIRHL